LINPSKKSSVDKKFFFIGRMGMGGLVSKAPMSFFFDLALVGAKVMVSAELIIVACVLIGVPPTWLVYLSVFPFVVS
jgi:hypothetical protein